MVINLPRTALKPEATFEWKIPKWSNAIERNRARTYFQAYVAAAALYFTEQALGEIRKGNTKSWTEFKVPDGRGFADAAQPGDWVTLHWGWVCEVLTDRQRTNLERYTRHHLAIANQTI